MTDQTRTMANMTGSKPKLLFVSPRFLFPADSGGKIRTGDILRGMKGGKYNIILASPVPDNHEIYKDSVAEICDHFIHWPEQKPDLFYHLKRVLALLSPLPVAVASDISNAGKKIIADALAQTPDMVVVDFPHACVLTPKKFDCPSVMFTHNVEFEIFKRHIDVAENPLMKFIWQRETRKMQRFEKDALSRFDTVIAVSEKDANFFRTQMDMAHVAPIPTGVDLNRFPYNVPSGIREDGPSLVFTGSMDWIANQDAIDWMIDEVWPLLALDTPDIRLTVVGKNPPQGMINRTKEKGLNIYFTGFVDSIVPYVHGAEVYIIPIRVGSGTRIKTYEAMALGRPVVSTTIGVEGLPIVPDQHYLCADRAEKFADAVLSLLKDPTKQKALAQNARSFVEENFASGKVARAFEQICIDTANRKKH